MVEGSEPSETPSASKDALQLVPRIKNRPADHLSLGQQVGFGSRRMNIKAFAIPIDFKRAGIRFERFVSHIYEGT